MMIKHIWNRLQLLASSGTVARVSGAKAQVQVLDNEVLGNIKLVTPFGFSHGPKPGSQSHMVFPGGDRSFGIALIVGDTRYDMAMQPGEVAIHDDKGNYCHIKADGSMEVKSSVKVLATTPLFETSADCKIGGNLNVLGSVTVRGKDVSDLHTHTSTTPGTHTSAVN